MLAGRLIEERLFVKSMRVIKVAIFPDNFAKYRVPVFRAIGKLDNLELTIFSPCKGRSRGNVAIARKDVDYFWSDSFFVIENRNVLYKANILWTSKLISTILGRRFEWVIVWGEIQNGSVWLALILGRLLGRKVIVWTHGLYGNERWWKRKLRVLQCRLAKEVFLYGNRAKELLHRDCISGDRLHVVYNSLNYDKIKQTRERITLSDVTAFRKGLFADSVENTRILLFVGRLTDSRQMEVVFHSLYQLGNCDRDWRLVIVGSGPSESTYRALVESLNLGDRVRFDGAIYSEEKLGLYFLASDLVVSPGAVGLLAVHAHSYGKPVCTHDSTISKQKPESEIIEEGKTGFRFQEGCPRHFQEKILEWDAGVKNMDDLERACIKKVERFYNPSSQANIIGNVLRAGK